MCLWSDVANAQTHIRTALRAAPPASPLRGITDAMIEAGAKVHDPFAFGTDTSMPLHRAQSKDEARKEVRAILAAAFSASPPMPKDTM